MRVTTEQAMMAELVSDLLGAHEREAAARRDGPDDGTALWQQLEELGLTLAAVPEDKGGSGGSVADVFVILREAGSHALSLPLMETGLAAWLLTEAELPVAGGPMAVAPAGFGDRIVAGGGSGETTLNGISHGTPFAGAASRLVVAARDESGEAVVAVVEPDQVKAVPIRNAAGGTRDLIEFRDVPAQAIAVADRAEPEQLLRRAALGRCSMIVGALGTVRDMSVAYAAERTQFGRPLLRFQAVAHQLAIIAREEALAAAVTHAAIEALLADDVLPLVEVAAAKVVCGKAATTVSSIAHQLHGAIGVTSEHPLSRFTSQLLAWRDDYGGERAWSTALGRDLATTDPWACLSRTGHLRSAGLEEARA
jgi:acyl-CoA dehydrogenase